ncbi:MAG TPA: hypothetical protein PLV06_06175 [Bacteroidales bacterium]|nr:hypothetical protein [Bacteroidales bacterium]HPJ58805.1 hypothetical protein [Bacteroidales bacterium]HPR11955.1 hypothetical protein [Bacteroidales bacterium]HRW85753.1 hypothetical protein [Bacteroidales bacterium]
MKTSGISAIILAFFIDLSGQTISPEMISLGNFVKRMYEASPFEGVKIVEDYNKSYLISVVMLDKTKYASDIEMNKVAAIKARSNVGKFLNGTDITTDFLIQTEEKKSDTGRTEVITYDIVRERSVGIVEAMQTLISFNASNGKYYVYVLFREYTDIIKKHE